MMWKIISKQKVVNAVQGYKKKNKTKHEVSEKEI